jgi:hypothetical protein
MGFRFTNESDSESARPEASAMIVRYSLVAHVAGSFTIKPWEPAHSWSTAIND